MIDTGVYVFLDDQSPLVWDQRDGSVSEDVLAAKPNHLSLILQTHMVGEENSHKLWEVCYSVCTSPISKCNKYFLRKKCLLANVTSDDQGLPCGSPQLTLNRDSRCRPLLTTCWIVASGLVSAWAECRKVMGLFSLTVSPLY